MHDVIPTTSLETMSSREIANLYGKPHYNVLRKIRKLEKAYTEVFGTDVKFYVSEYTDPTGRKLPEILLNKSQALFVASRFDAVLHAKVQKRWEELEAQARQQMADPVKVLNDPAAMRGLLLNYTEKVLALEEKVKETAPKAEALERIAHAEGATCITDTAKTLQIRPKELFDWLSANKWIYRRPGGKGWIAYQRRIQQGVLTHKVITVSDIHTGKERVIEHVLVTPKGLSKLAKVFEEVAA